MPRIRKDSETLSNSGYSTISRGRREGERLRTDVAYVVDNANPLTHRNISNTSIGREVKTKNFTGIYLRKKNKSFLFCTLKENQNLSFTTKSEYISCFITK